MKQKLQSDLKSSMKDRNQIRTLTIRGVLAEITRLEKDVRREATDDEVLQMIKRERARRDESLSFARTANRTDLIEQYESEAKVLDTYLPAALTEAELKAAIARHIEGGTNQIGPLMKRLRDEFGARLDGKTASELVKATLASK